MGNGQIPLQDKAGYPLTRLQYQKDYWAKVCKQNKASLIDGLVQYCKVQDDDLQELGQSIFLCPQSFHIGNINVTFAQENGSKKHYLQSVGLPEEQQPMMKDIKTTPVQQYSKK